MNLDFRMKIAFLVNDIQYGLVYLLYGGTDMFIYTFSVVELICLKYAFSVVELICVVYLLCGRTDMFSLYLLCGRTDMLSISSLW